LPLPLNSNNQSIAGYRHREQVGLTVIEQSATIPGRDEEQSAEEISRQAKSHLLFFEHKLRSAVRST
jgi:hypothetical protein